MGTTPAVRRHYVEGRWGQLHFYRAAPERPSRRPLVCFHLSPSSARMYEPFIAEMGRDRLAVAVDTPGYGGSDAPPRPPDSLGEYSAALGDLLDALKLESVDLFGAHTGSRLAVELAHQRPKQIHRLILFGAAVYTEAERAAQQRTYVETPRDTAITGAYLARRWDGWCSWRWPGVSDAMVLRSYVASLDNFERSWWAHNTVFRHDMGARLKALAQETMVLCCKDDIYEPTQRAKDWINRGRYVERADWGHWFLEVKTAEAADLARGFLDS
ncbi:MAG: alpha/beta hydrolase [Alphaproteobacteria bacterium]|nr:alpha/beta hydrolase [Alphaproteobacteria bacterium]